jgi:hypothetical protein
LKRRSPATKKNARLLSFAAPDKLKTLTDTCAEMARIYCLTLEGELELERMTKLIYALKEIRCCIEINMLDEAPRRLAEIEAKLEEERD